MIVEGTTPQLRDLTAEQRDALHTVYLSITPLHHLKFDECLADRGIQICLWNVAKARQKKRARQAAAEEVFQLK